jgi:hypothetical protein
MEVNQGFSSNKQNNNKTPTTILIDTKGENVILKVIFGSKRMSQ